MTEHRKALAVILSLAVVSLAAHLFFAVGYGYFIDELYTIACGRHLSWGYVDIPPLAPALSALSGTLFGYSLFAIHVLPAVSSALTVVFAGFMALELGGSWKAALLTGLCVLIAPMWLATGSMMAYDTFDQMFTVLFLLILARIFHTGGGKIWLVAGVAAGLCLLTKFTVGFVSISLFASLLLTKRRKHLKDPYLWAGMGIALALMIPYFLWQATHGWPVVEYFIGYAGSRTYSANPLEYILMQFVIQHPLTVPLWGMGLYYFFFHRQGQEHRVWAWLYVFLFLIFFIALKAKVYMIMATVIPLLAGGAVWIEKLTAGERRRWITPVLAAVLLIGGVLAAPISLPVLKPDRLESYFRAIQGFWMFKTDNDQTVEFPQFIADRFGWDTLVIKVADIYRSLPETDRKVCMIVAANYGQAGAVDLLGKAYGLPDSVCGHLSYWYWGYRDNTGEVAIVIDSRIEEMRNFFNEVKEIARISTKYALPGNNNYPILLCRKPRMPLKDAWKYARHFD